MPDDLFDCTYALPRVTTLNKRRKQHPGIRSNNTAGTDGIRLAKELTVVVKAGRSANSSPSPAVISPEKDTQTSLKGLFPRLRFGLIVFLSDEQKEQNDVRTRTVEETIVEQLRANTLFWLTKKPMTAVAWSLCVEAPTPSRLRRF